MADAADEPVFAISRWDRWSWRRRFVRVAREGTRARNAAVLERLRTDLLGQRLVADQLDRTVTEFAFEDGTRLRLGWCHRPTVRALHDLARHGDVRLARVDRHRHLWALYVATVEGVVPLLSSEVRLVDDQGGMRFLLDVLGGDRPPALV